MSEEINIEMQLIINRRLYERNIIDRITYETAMNELLKSLKAIKATERTG
ncbi:MAG: hypothetical protein LBD23_10545 [Oscillospiraceae bacterium]|jgi:hypothetical protein|nr:hypothetical protein [Oscillospiraceae bacterium]